MLLPRRNSWISGALILVVAGTLPISALAQFPVPGAGNPGRPPPTNPNFAPTGPTGGGFPGGGRGARGGRSGGFGGGFGNGINRAYTIRDPAELEMVDKMQQAINPAFVNDVYSFTRLKYDFDPGYRGRFWDDDSPDADLNLSYRLFQITSLKIHPYYNYIDITPETLAHNPFVYMTVTRGMALTDDNIKVLRNYLLQGGFLMAEDFWGDTMWNFALQQFGRIFPDRQLVELPLSHPLFHSVFDFTYLPQMPSAGPGYRGNSWDNSDYPTGDHFPHYYAIFDDHDRIMAVICRNNHYGDGWEHEGDNHEYFDKFSMPQAYPMMINILFYAMTN